MAEFIAPATRNVTRIFRAATPAQSEAGMAWYADARNIAEVFANFHGIPVGTAAGVIAALSPLQSWGANVSLAARLIAAGGLSEGYLSDGLGKANAILAGAAPADVLTSDKVGNFYRCIVAAGETSDVCVDRHAYSLAVNTRFAGEIPNLTPKRYGIVADTYRRAADILAVPAAKVQAVTWGVWRQRYWAPGAFDGYSPAVEAMMQEVVGRIITPDFARI
jgi:hypothetical protein